MNKSPDAFRTISEVADLLETPAHVLRFWESRFPQIRPVKRAGGRRYYRPADVALLTGIKRLLHDEGMTIRGVQKILREQGVRHVAGTMDDSSEAEDDAALEAALSGLGTGAAAPDTLPPAEAETAQVIALQTALRDPDPAAVGMAPDDMPVTEAMDDPDEADPIPAPDQTPVLPDAPPPPVMAPPVMAPPVESDLFSLGQPTPTPEPVAEVAEAPMALWAEEPYDDDEPSDGAQAVAPPVVTITRIGGSAPALPPAPSGVESQTASGTGGPTMAIRLRATPLSRLTKAERDRLAEIRDRAIALRKRMTLSNRMPF